MQGNGICGKVPVRPVLDCSNEYVHGLPVLEFDQRRLVEHLNASHQCIADFMQSLRP